MSETKQNYDWKPRTDTRALRSNRSLIEFIMGHGASDGKQLPHDGAPPTEQTSTLEDDWA